jgi:O-acetyl-ADP-ribose deacetylase (regulator of RNase III)
MRRASIADVDVEVDTGDITAQPDIDAVVNAANAELMPGGGVAGAIHRAAGPGLAEECAPHAPIRPGQAVLTGGHQLPNPHVIHCLGPVYGVDEPAEDLLASCYRNALQLADREGLASIAFPAISTGAFGYPMDAAAETAMRTAAETAPQLSSVKRIRFVLFDQRALQAHEDALDRLTTSD